MSGHDPHLPSDGAAIEAREETGVVAVVTPEASASLASQLDLAADAPLKKDILELDYGDDDDCTSELLISEDEEEDDIFTTPARAVQPVASADLSGWI